MERWTDEQIREKLYGGGYSMADSGYTAMVQEIKNRLGVDDDPDYGAAEIFEDIASHGADSGWGGFTYTSECVEFFDAHESTIMDLAQEDADSFGYSNVAEFVAGFARADMADTMDGYKNLLAWYALETVAQREVNE